MQEYLVRHATERKRLKDVKIDIPSQLAGWHFLPDAYLGYLEARKKMREIANARGFYPIFAIGPETATRTPAHSSKGKAQGKRIRQR